MAALSGVAGVFPMSRRGSTCRGLSNERWAQRGVLVKGASMLKGRLSTEVSRRHTGGHGTSVRIWDPGVPEAHGRPLRLGSIRPMWTDSKSISGRPTSATGRRCRSQWLGAAYGCGWDGVRADKKQADEVHKEAETLGWAACDKGEGLACHQLGLQHCPNVAEQRDSVSPWTLTGA